MLTFQRVFVQYNLAHGKAAKTCLSSVVNKAHDLVFKLLVKTVGTGPGSSILGSGNILSWRLVMKSFLWPVSPYRQLSVTGERMCT